MSRPLELIRGLHNLRPEHRGCVATIGNYDGVHRGHQHMLEATRRSARKAAWNRRSPPTRTTR